MQQDLIKYQRALFLRKKKGYSYSEIMEELPVAKSTLSEWLGKIVLSKAQQERIKSRTREALIRRRFNLPEFNRRRRQQEIYAIREQAKSKIGRLTKREFLIAGVMLYWAEGNKGGRGIRISNADPLFIKFIMDWFRKCLSISEDRFSASVHYHEGQNEHFIKEFWSEVTNITMSAFNKSFKKPPGTGHHTHYLQWGVRCIRIRRSANLFHQISAWKDGLIKEIVSDKPVQ